MNWEVFAYGSGDMLRMVFTAIASLFGNNDYMAAMQTTALLGFVVVLFKAAFDRNVMANFRWFIGMIVVLMVVLVPKTTVVINDRITPNNNAVVNNVPIGLGATAGFLSYVGDWLARTFETIFSMPSEVRYTASGLLFPQKLYEATRKMGIPDARVAGNFTQFFSSCVIIDGIGHNRFTWGDLIAATDLVEFFSTNVASYAASFKYTAANGSESLEFCKSGFENKLLPELQNMYEDIIKYGIDGGLIARFGSKEAAANKVKAELQNTLSFMTGTGISAKDYVIQQAIINAMATGTHKLAQEIGSNEYAAYITSGAEIHRLTTYQALGQIASEKLPLLRIIFETIIYAIFPLIALMAVVQPGKVIMGYAVALVWINLWAPMYAILHFIITYYSAATKTEILALYEGGFSVLANWELFKFNADVVATTGYIATAIPMLAWMLVSRSGAMAASLAGRVMQGYDTAVEKGANEILEGKGMRQGVEWRMAEGGGVQQNVLTQDGALLTETASGRHVMTQATSKLVVDASQTEATIQSQQAALEKATANAKRWESAVAEITQSVLSNSAAVLQRLGAENSTNQSFKEAETVQHQQNFTKLKAAVDEWAKANNIELTDEQRAAMYAAVEGKIVGEFGTPLKGIFGSGTRVVASTSVGGRVEGTTSSRETDSYRLAANFSESEQFATVVSSIGQGVRELAASFGLKQGEESVDQLNSSLSEQDTAQKQYAVAVTEMESAKTTLSAAQEFRAAISVDNGQTILESLMHLHNNDVKKVEKTLLAAQGGSQEAMYEIQHALLDRIEKFNMSDNATFQKVAEEMGVLKQEGIREVDETYASGAGTVTGKAGERMGLVEGQAPVTQEQFVDAMTMTLLSNEKAMQDPSRVVTQPNAMDQYKQQVEDKGLPTQTAVETITYLEDTFLGAEVEFNRGQQSAQHEKLEASAQARFKELNQKRAKD